MCDTLVFQDPRILITEHFAEQLMGPGVFSYIKLLENNLGFHLILPLLDIMIWSLILVLFQHDSGRYLFDLYACMIIFLVK
jgi:hypothetical protein